MNATHQPPAVDIHTVECGPAHRTWEGARINPCMMMLQCCHLRPHPPNVHISALIWACTRHLHVTHDARMHVLCIHACIASCPWPQLPPNGQQPFEHTITRSCARKHMHAKTCARMHMPASTCTHMHAYCSQVQEDQEAQVDPSQLVRDQVVQMLLKFELCRLLLLRV